MIVVVGDEDVVMVAVTGPLTCDHAPAPTEAVFAAIVAEPLLAQMVCGEPAFAVVGGGFTVMVTCELVAVHGALPIDHWNT